MVPRGVGPLTPMPRPQNFNFPPKNRFKASMKTKGKGGRSFSFMETDETQSNLWVAVPYVLSRNGMAPAAHPFPSPELGALTAIMFVLLPPQHTRTPAHPHTRTLTPSHPVTRPVGAPPCGVFFPIEITPRRCPGAVATQRRTFHLAQCVPMPEFYF